MCDQQRLNSACPYAQTDQSLCWSLEYSMVVKLLIERHLEFLSLKGGCTGSSESTLVIMPHCWKSHAMPQNFTVTFYKEQQHTGPSFVNSFCERSTQAISSQTENFILANSGRHSILVILLLFSLRPLLPDLLPSAGCCLTLPRGEIGFLGSSSFASEKGKFNKAKNLTVFLPINLNMCLGCSKEPPH